MSKTAPVSVRLESALNDQVTAIAAALDRPKSWVIEQAVRDFVAIQEWQLAAVDAGISAADAGADVHDGVVTVRRQRLYSLVSLPDDQRHRLSLRFADGVTGYAFTFG